MISAPLKKSSFVSRWLTATYGNEPKNSQLVSQQNGHSQEQPSNIAVSKLDGGFTEHSHQEITKMGINFNLIRTMHLYFPKTYRTFHNTPRHCNCREMMLCLHNFST